MKSRIAILLAAIVGAGCAKDIAVPPPAPAAPPMPLGEARKVVRDAFYEWAPWGYDTTVTEVRISAHGVSALVTPGWADGWADGSRGPKELTAGFTAPLGGYRCQEGKCWVDMPPTPRHGAYWVLMSRSRSESERVVRAFNTLVAFNSASLGDPAEFEQAATRWRAMPAKPPLSPEAERRRVLAEAAFRDKELDLAMEHYQAALVSDPTWPSGNFNLALLLGEAGYYARAVQYMQRYLTLVPDAKDAKAAHEKIMVWQDRASRSGT